MMQVASFPSEALELRKQAGFLVFRWGDLAVYLTPEQVAELEYVLGNYEGV